MKLKLCKASLMLIAMQALTVPVIFDVMAILTKGVFGMAVLVLLSLGNVA